MGGYGYFDFGELELRSDELSRNDSYLNSQTHSNLSSALSSRRHSFTNLLKIASRTNAQNYDIKRNNHFQKESETNYPTVKIHYLLEVDQPSTLLPMKQNQ